jgi:hypothetical protein
MKRVLAVVFTCFLLLGLLTGLGVAGAARSAKMTARLTTMVKTARGSGRFTGSLLRYSNGKSKLTWTLTYRNLGRRTGKAEILVPAKGHQSQVYVLLCRSCRARSHGVVKPILKASTSALLTRPAYVVVSTKEHPKGALRGRILRSG